ncbi:MAG: class I SAM-dependent methyltransferase [Dehalococcoidia bacterium]
MDDPYAIDAEYYDLWNRGGDEDVGLWLSFAGRTDRPVLEVGTGTGRIALELARRGHEVVGVDPSAAMLARARAKADDEGLEMQFIEGRVTDLALEAETYGFVLIPADVFLQCEDGEDQMATLRKLAACMTFDAVLALDLPGPAAALDAVANGQPTLAWSGPLADGSVLDVWQVHEDDLAQQRRWMRVSYEVTAADGTVRRRISEHALRYIGRFEAEYLLRMAGFVVGDVYGDYDLAALTNESERMVVVARRAAG